MGIIGRPPVRPFTTLSGFCALANKSLGRNGIRNDMLVYPDDLPSADIDADGYCCILCICPSFRPSVGLSLGIADKSLQRNGLHFGMLTYLDDLPSVHRRL